MKRIITTFILGLILVPSFAFATPTSWDFASGVLQPLQSMWTAVVKGNYFTATSTTATSTFPSATTSRLSVGNSLNVFGVLGDAWSDFCTAITGGASLCDGSDADTTYTAGDALTLTGNDFDFDGGATPSGDLGGTWASPSVSNDSHDHTGVTLSGIDISSDTNLTAGDALTLTDDDIDFDGGASPAGALGGTWASPTVDDDGHNHTGTTLSSIDISNDTNLSADGTEIILTGDALSLGTALTFTTGTSSTAFQTALLGIGTDYISDITGTGLSITNGVLNASASGGSNWIKNLALDALRPSTTIGIVINSSSTIDSLTTTYGTTTNATSTNLYVSGKLTGAGLTSCSDSITSKLLWNASLGQFSCGTDQSGGGGGSGGGWATTTGTNDEVAEEVTYTSTDVFIGGSAATTTVFNFDPEKARFIISSTTANATGTIDSPTGGIIFGSTTVEAIEMNFNTSNTLKYISSTGINLADYGGIGLRSTASSSLSNLSISALKDSTWSLGTNGMVLQTNGSTAQWVATNTLGLGTVTSVAQTVPTGFTITGSPITTAGTLAIAYDTGYGGVLTASTSNWNAFYDTPSTRITAGTGIDWSGNTLNGVYTAGDALTLNGEDFDFDGGASPAGALGGTWASPTVDDDGHAHTGATLSGIDISGDTNLTADGTEIILTDDALSLGTALTLINASTTYASTTALSVFGNLHFGGVSGSSWSAFCTAITGGAGLCDGSDDGGGSGELSDWQQTIAGVLSPTTTVGIRVNASSTIGDGTGAGGLTIFGSATTTSDLIVGAGINLFGGGVKTTANSLCVQLTGSADLCDGSDGGGGGSSKWTDGSTPYTYLTNTTYDLALGSSATETAPFWWDVSATTSYIGNGGAGDSVITLGPTGSEWTMGFDDTDDSFRISTSTALGQFDFLRMFSTSTLTSSATGTNSILSGVRSLIGPLPPYFQNTSIASAGLYVNGQIDSPYFYLKCLADTIIVLPTGDANTGCNDAVYAEDATGATTAFADLTIGTESMRFLGMSDATANSGNGLFFDSLSSIKLASSTPTFEATVIVNTTTNSASSTMYVGFTNITVSGSAFEVPPTHGAFFTASSTQGTWLFKVKSGNDEQTFTTTFASTSVAFMKISGDKNYVYGWIGSSTAPMRLVGVGVNKQGNNGFTAGAYMARITAGGSTAQLRIYSMELWKKKPYALYSY